MENFGVKYVEKKHTDHLVNTLTEHYEISQDWEGKKHCGLTFEWDYQKIQVHLLIPGYVDKALKRFKHEPPRKHQDQQHKSQSHKNGPKARHQYSPRTRIFHSKSVWGVPALFKSSG